MPIIDVSQSSYRALISAAHRRGMSVDRFIQDRFVGQAEEPGEIDPARAGQPASGRRPAEAARPRIDRLAPDSSFEALWGRIEQNAGTEISTRRGHGFTYEVETGYLTVRESGARVPRSQFKKALSQWPAAGPATMRGVYAPSVVWAVLAAFADRRFIDVAA